MVKKMHIVLFLLFQIVFGLTMHGITVQEKSAITSTITATNDTSKVKKNKKIKVPKIEVPKITKPEIPKAPKIEVPKVAGVDISKTSGGVFSRDSLKSFYKDFKSLLTKHKFRKPSLKSQIFSLKDTISARIDSMKALKLKLEAFKVNEKLLGDVIKRLSPSLNGPLIEWSLHAIEESKYLNLYDSKRYYKTEVQWAEYSGRDKDDDSTRFDRYIGDKTVYGFHPFWLGQYYYNYNFELYDRVAYFGYSVSPETGESATLFPAHSFINSQIVKKANKQSKGNCKVDLCVSSYGLQKNIQLFSQDWENKINKLVYDVTNLVVSAKGDGICLDFQQVPDSDAFKFIKMVKLFREKFDRIDPERYQISIVLPSYSQYFPYNVSSKDFADLNKYADRFIVMGYSSFSGLYNPEKDSLAVGTTHDALWNVLLIDDGLNHYASLLQDLDNKAVSSERMIEEKLLLSLPTNEIKLFGDDSIKILKYSDLKLLKLDEGFLPAFQEKLAYANLKGLKGVAVWSMGNDNGLGNKDIQKLLAAYTFGTSKQDKSMLAIMEKLINENKTLNKALDEFFPKEDSTYLTEVRIPLPNELEIELPVSASISNKTQWEKELAVIQHVVVLCLIILIIFAVIGVVVALFFESVREFFLTKENIIFLVSVFSLLAFILLLKNLNWMSNTLLLFSLGILIGIIIPFLIRKKQRKNQSDNRP
jgi:hypothetical protein